MSNDVIKIRRALLKAVREINLGLPIAKGNNKFEPPESGAWLETSFLPDSTTSCGKTINDGDFREGTFQVSVYDQLGQGELQTLTVASAVDKAFYHGRILAVGGLDVQIRRVELEPAFETGGYWHQPISIDYQTITQRT